METPLAVPVNAPILTVPVGLLVQVPPVTISVYVIGIPIQMIFGPIIGPGTGLTVTIVAIWQPVDVNVYMIVVVPVNKPLTIPEVEPIVAIAVLVLVQVPPGVASVSKMVVPGHKADGPTINAGIGLTTKIALSDIVRVHPVAALVAVTL